MNLQQDIKEHYVSKSGDFETEKKVNMLSGQLCEVSQLYFARINLCNIKWGDIVLALKECKKTGTWHDWEDWYRCWKARGQVFEKQGDEAGAAGSTVTAREALLRAAACYHFAEFMYFTNPTEKNATRRKVTETFDKAIPFLEHSIRKISIPFGRLRLPGYLLAPDKNGPHPCVILNNGMESAKEAELYSFAQSFMKRGIAVLMFDGPGQGEFLGYEGMVKNWEDVIGAILDFAVDQPEVDPDRIGMFGVSFGGYLCVRGATFHPDRVKAAINLSGCYDIDNFPDLRGMVPDDFKYVFKKETVEEMTRFAMEDLNLRDAPPLRRPLLTIHSKTDSLFPYETAVRLHEWAVGEKELIAYDHEWHVCTNHMSEFVPIFCDWIKLKLTEQAGVKLS
jgi:dipeptidyl aminopeptidase/acylaminoacyl peptidase